MTAKPGKADYAAISGSWTLWPLSVEITAKGAINCQFYVLNAPGKKSTQIENLELAIAAGDPSNYIAYMKLPRVKASIASGASRAIKVTFPASACGDLTGIFLPNLVQQGALFFDTDVNDSVLKSKKNSYTFISTLFPLDLPDVVPVNPIISMEMDRSEATMTMGASITLAVSVQPLEAANQKTDWSTSAPKVATVKNGVGKGTAVITAAATDGSNVKATCTVTVNEIEKNKNWDKFDSDISAMVYEYDKNVFVSKNTRGYERGRLIVKVNETLPDVSTFKPASIILDPEDHYFIQFTTSDDAAACAEYLQSLSNIIYVEADRSIVNCDETLIAVVDDKKERTYFSYYGDAEDIAAPGVSIKSALPGNKYGYKDSTSMATPHVAAATRLWHRASDRT